MRAVVIVPAFAFDDARLAAWKLVRMHLDELGWSVVSAHGRTPAAARNRAAQAWAVADVLVFNDADTVVPLEQIRVAASLARDEPGLVFAFDDYYRLAEPETLMLADAQEALAMPYEQHFREPPSHGCVAISRACFEAVGGYDERLEVYEDCALTARCAALWPLRRVAGPAVHLWHPRPLGDVDDPRFQERYAESRRLWEAEYPWPVTA